MTERRTPYGGGLPPAPARAAEPICPLDCDHRNLLVMSSRAIGTDNNNHRYEVRLCRVCGHFSVWGEQNGEHFDFGFELVRDEYIEAAGKYIEYLNRDDKARKVGSNDT